MAEKESGSDIELLVRDYIWVKVREDVYGGWRTDLLCEEVNGSEERLITCVGCRGLLREASGVKRGLKLELRCYTCIPESCSVVQAAETIGEVIAEKNVSLHFN